MISTKGRYSIRILLDLAEHRNGKYIPMKRGRGPAGDFSEVH